jgi:two-component system, NtrC family, nitrogen regulation sensor histidine kinase NtrY
MNLIATFIFRFRYWLLALLGWILFFYFHSQPSFNEAKKKGLQNKFIAFEESLDTHLKYWSNEPINYRYPEKKSDFDDFIYRGDSLIYWTSNSIPIDRFAAIQFPANGVVRLQNGWYYVKTIEKNKLIFCSTFLLSNVYSIQNEFLSTNFNPNLSDLPLSISLNPEDGEPIFGKNGQIQFYVEMTQINRSERNDQFALFSLLFGLFFLLFAVYQLLKNQPFNVWLFLISILATRLLTYQNNWYNWLGDATYIDAELFAYNTWFASFLDFCLNQLVVGFVSLLLFRNVISVRRKWMLWSATLLLFPLWWFIVKSVDIIVVNSNIPFDLTDLFNLNMYAVLVILLFGFLFFTFQRLLFGVVQQVSDLKVSPAIFTAYFFLFGVGFIIYRVVQDDLFIMPLVLPIALYFINFLFGKSQSLNRILLFNLAITALFAIAFVEEIHFFNAKKDKELRGIYAAQLSIDQDLNLELDFAEIRKKLILDPLIQAICKGNPERISASKLSDVLEKKYFKGLWEAYDFQCALYDSVGRSPLGNEQAKREYWRKLKERNGEISAIDSTIVFIQDDVSAFNYLIFQPIQVDAAHFELIIGLKSKRIPEEIGFPRLLISTNAKVLSSLENYAIAKYSGGKLVKHYGEYNFPTALSAFPIPKKDASFFNFDGFNHHAYRKNASSIIIISRNNSGIFDQISAFSYVFTLWGILLLTIPFFRGKSKEPAFRMSLAFRIQAALVVIVVLGLILFGTGSGLFVRNQYTEYTNRIIAEKLHAVEEELRGKITQIKILDVEEHGGYMESVLMKLSKVFVTDLNLYNPHGQLIATSRPKIFNQGLLSELINPKALNELKWNNKSFFSHKEEIGKLAYVSSYLPIYNGEGLLLGYINLQHFGQQRDFEQQIQRFLVSIINVFMLMLALTIILALFVSNWLIRPLKLLSEQVSNWKLGGKSKRIPYDGKDEIGALIQAYNGKLEELNEAANQLAKNERESAWREMAKQVAHEIKNPLTPMKLSIQHLARTYQPDKPVSKERMNNFLESLIEQIDGLTKIANAFSNFAKMPEPIKEKIDLLPILIHVLDLFEAEVGVQINREVTVETTFVDVDKNQIVQVANNLLKNALQSIPTERKPVILMRIWEENNHIYWSVQDNGIGISESSKPRIFQPHFTTKSSGSGIGLALSKQIIENHQGVIFFDSIEGKGATFTVQLPLTPLN